MLSKEEKNKIIHDFNSGIHGIRQAIVLLDENKCNDEIYQTLIPLLKDKVFYLNDIWTKLKNNI